MTLHEIRNPSTRRRVIAYTVLLLALGALAFAFRGPIVSWFTGEPMASGEPAAPAKAAPTLACEDLPDGALEPLRTAFTHYEEVRALLAADRLEGLGPAAERLAGAFETAHHVLGSAARGTSDWLEEGQEAARRLAGADGLGEARTSFGEVSRVLVGLAACEPRLAEGWQVFECPMQEGFNKWVQRPGDLSNPYMGPAMLTCGSATEWSTVQLAAAGDAHAGHAAGEVAYWTCPMHPSVRQQEPGKCPICGMDLTPVSREQAASGEVVLDPERRQLIGVTTGTVVTQPIETEVRAVGRIAIDETRLTDVTVKYGGYIGRLYVEETGRPVRKGQTLFTLYSPELYAAQREYLVALASQRAARQTGAPDRADYLVEAARQKLRLWDFSDAQIRNVAEKGAAAEQIAVPSPASGYVVEKDVVEGAAVQPGMRLYRIAALDRVWVDAEVYESELPRVRVGQPARITLPYLPGEEFRGRVSLIYPSLNPETRTGRVRVEVANRAAGGALALKPDMYADVLLEGEGREALMVPSSAVLYTGPRNLVFLDQGEGRFEPREIELGPRSGDFFVVRSGLEEGERVVTSGNFLIDAEARLRSGGGTGDGHQH